MPRNMQKIHIFFYILQATRPAPVLDYIAIKDNLLKKCSKLRCLWLQRAGDVFFWHRKADGQETLSRASSTTSIASRCHFRY